MDGTCRNLQEQEDMPPSTFDDHPLAIVLFGWPADPDVSTIAE